METIGVVLAVAGLGLLGLFVVAVGVLGTVSNHRTFGPATGAVLSQGLWAVLADALGGIVRLVLALLGVRSSA